MAGTAIVIGSTGLVGKSLVEQLVRATHVGEVVSITRRAVMYASPKVANHVVDFERLDEFRSLFRGDWLFSCLGTTRAQAGSIDAQRRVDVDYQFAAARMAAANGLSHYLLVSSAGADSSSGNPYLRMKAELEQRVLELPFERVSIFQPSVLVGEREHSRPAEKIASAILSGLRFIPGLRRYRPIRGAEVAAKMVQTSREPGARVERFVLDEVFPR